MRRIRLDNQEFEGSNNAYLFGIDADGPTTLVDTGIAVDSTRRRLRDGLGEHRLDFGDVDQVLLTHFHADHSGLAGEIQAAGGATVRVHEADAPLVEHDPRAIREKRRQERDRFEAWGMPEGERATLEDRLDAVHEHATDPPAVEPFEAGDRFRVGDETVAAIGLPGHTAGLCGFAADGILFSGDALLPKYTPNVGGADVRVDRALATYLDSLCRIARADYELAYPGHRDEIDDPTGRAREIFEHHRERTGRVVDALREAEPADAWTISAMLFGDLEGIHVLHGPGEAGAHLEHLADHGVAERTDEGYVLVEDSPGLDATFPSFPG